MYSSTISIRFITYHCVVKVLQRYNVQLFPQKMLCCDFTYIQLDILCDIVQNQLQ